MSDELPYNIPTAIFTIQLNEAMDILYANNLFYDLYGINCNQINTVKWIDYIYQDEREKIAKLLNLNKDKANLKTVLHSLKSNGESMYLIIQGTIKNLSDKYIMTAAAIDITQEFKTFKDLENNKQNYKGALSQISDNEKTSKLQYNYIKQFRKSVFANTIFAYEVNVTKDKLIDGDYQVLKSVGVSKTDSYSKLIDYSSNLIPNPEHRKLFISKLNKNNLLLSFKKGITEFECEYIRLNLDKIPRWVCAKINLIEEPIEKDICAFIYIKDIDEYKKNELNLIEKTECDPLTGVYNRSTEQIKVDDFLKQNNSLCAFLLVDIDNFSDINRNFGNIYGDAVLSELIRNIKLIVPENNITGRIGGDEISILLTNLNNKEEALKISSQICNTLHMNYSSGNCRCEISGSIGIAFSPADGNSFIDLYNKADIALYNAKKSGKNKYIVFNKNLIENSNFHTEIEVAYGKRFSKNMVEYIFKILYQSNNLDFAITSVLELLAKAYNLEHSYLIEYNKLDDSYSMVFEWCDKGINSTKHIVQNIPSQEINNYLKNFNYRGILCIEDMSNYSQELYEFYNQLNIKSIVQCLIDIGDEIKGIIGIDAYEQNRTFSDEDRADIKISSEIIGIFLNNKRNEQKKEQYTKILKTILDNLNNYTYVVHPITFELIFINKKTKRAFPNAKLSNKCYNIFMDNKSPCKGCPIATIIEKQIPSYTTEMFNPIADIWFETNANWIDWSDGKRYCLINCNDISRYKKAELEIKHSKQEMDTLINTIPGGVAKLIINDDFRILLASGGYYRLTGYTKEECEAAPIYNKGINFVIEEDIDQVKSNVDELIKLNIPNCVEYRIRKKNGQIAWNTAYCSKPEIKGNDIIIEAVFIDTTDIKNTQQSLLRLTNSIPGGIARVRADNKLLVDYASDGFYRLIGYTHEEFNGADIKSQCSKIIHPTDLKMVLEKVKKFIFSDVESASLSYRIINKNGNIRWIGTSATKMNDEFSCSCELECIFSDITDSKIVEQKLILNQERYRILSEQITDCVLDWDIITDSIYISPAFKKTFGYEIPTNNFNHYIISSDTIYKDDKANLIRALNSLRNGKPYVETEYRIKNSIGDYTWCKFKAASIFDELQIPYRAVGTISDIDYYKKQSAMLQRKAETDLLTNILNKIATQEHIENILNNVKGEKHAFLLIDLDNFKSINDNLGHSMGDAVLIEVAKHIKQSFRDGDIIGRIGGDEFVILMRNINSVHQVSKKANILIKALRHSFKDKDKVYKISGSVGISIYPQNGDNFEQLYKKADVALYQSKKKGRDCFTIYSNSSNNISEFENINTRNIIESSTHSDINFITLIFEILYDTKDIDTAINIIIELVARHYNIGHIYIYENKNNQLIKTFEYCYDKDTKVTENKFLCSNEEIETYLSLCDRSGIFLCTDTNNLPLNLKTDFNLANINSVLQVPIKRGEALYGIIGFSESSINRYWTKDEIESIILLSKIISTFILKRN